MLSEMNLKSVGGYHFGRMIDLKKFEGSHFESNKADESNTIHKAILVSICYNADEIYNRTDGYAGNCWTVIINDSRLINNEYTYKLNFRNLKDLISHYESQDMKFCD
jgi:hypothetical protein